MKTILILALLCVACTGCEPMTLPATVESIEINTIEKIPKKYRITICNGYYMFTDTLYTVGDTIR